MANQHDSESELGANVGRSAVLLFGDVQRALDCRSAREARYQRELRKSPIPALRIRFIIKRDAVKRPAILQKPARQLEMDRRQKRWQQQKR